MVELIGDMPAKHVDRARRTLVYQVDWPASVRRAEERVFEHVVVDHCILSMFIRDELEQAWRPVPAHKLVANFRSCGEVTTLLSEEGRLDKAWFPPTWLHVRVHWQSSSESGSPWSSSSDRASWVRGRWLEAKHLGQESAHACR